MPFDCIFDDAEVLDGTGAAARTASVGIEGDRITAIGDLGDAESARRIDCRGRVLAPGFIDMHSHADWVLPQPDHGRVLAPLVEQGITTLVSGNCGCTPAPLAAPNRGIVPALGRMLHDEDLDYRWESTADYLAALEANGLALNNAQLVGHGTVRTAVKGFDLGPASEAEVRAMADVTRAALDEGAIGLSTGLGYAPGVFADLDELIGVTAPLRERDAIYTSHARSYVSIATRASDERPSNLAALDETAAIHRAHGVPVQHSHLIFVGDVTWPSTDRVLEHLDVLVDDGVDIACDAFPYVGGNTTIVVFLPPWALSDARAKVVRPDTREKLVGALDRVQASVGMRWEDTQILWVPDRSMADLEGRSVAEIARERGRGGTETYLDLIAELGPETRIMNWNYSGRDDEETSLRKVLGHARCCIETDTILTGNGFDNPASYGTFPRVLGRYVRELGLLSLPEAIRRMTGFSAERMGLRDRGRIAEGLAADLVVFDPETIGDQATREAPGERPSGIETVVMNGQIVLENGRFDTRARAGRVLRRA
jgi:N-acyl-D-amino-acid deacylase